MNELMTPPTVYFVIVGTFIILDIISGVAQAIANHGVSSTPLKEGAWHKFAYIIMLALAWAIETAMFYVDLGYTVPILPVVTVYLVGTEVVSIMENAVKLNPELAGASVWKYFQNSNQPEERDGVGFKVGGSE